MVTVNCYGGKKMRRVSRWIKVRQNYNPNKRNALWDYVLDEYGHQPYQGGFNPAGGLCLDYFRYGGRTYALSQFLSLGSIWIGGDPILYDEKNGKLGVISAVDMDGNLFHPLYAEFDECCEHVRLYEEAKV